MHKTCTHARTHARTHTHLLELVGVRREVFPGLLDVHNDVGKDAQSVVVPARHQVAEPNVVVQADLAGRDSGVGQDLHRREGTGA